MDPEQTAPIEAFIGDLGKQDICHFTSRDIGYYPFYFQGCGILCSITGILLFSSKINKYKVERQKNVNKKSFKVFHYGREAACTIHGKFIFTWVFRRSIIFSLSALIMPPPKSCMKVLWILSFEVCGSLTVYHIYWTLIKTSISELAAPV